VADETDDVYHGKGRLDDNGAGTRRGQDDETNDDEEVEQGHQTRDAVMLIG